jgi:PadR family transcriptional regulator PadR
MPKRVTRQLLAVLEALVTDPAREWYGLELMDMADLSSGTLYPILHRLVADGWLVRTRDTSSLIGGSGRRLYRLTGVGARMATDLLASRGRRHHSITSGVARGVQPA